MKNWKLKVKGYGKIKNAEIEAAPLTLFVGDNNSGKSYLMSLLWGIQNLGVDALLGSSVTADNRTEIEKEVFEWIEIQVNTALEQMECVVPVSSIIDKLQILLQEKLDRNKNDLIKKIFNSPAVVIEKLVIKLQGLSGGFLNFKWINESRIFRVILEINGDFSETGFIFGKNLLKYEEDDDWLIIRLIYKLFMDINLNEYTINEGIYLPSARTGFMLTKDLINKVSRKAVYNIDTEEEIVPFVRPVNQFLDVINDLSIENLSDNIFSDIVEDLEKGLIDGSINMSALPNKEVRYFPAGCTEELPLRVASAVVTELAPLILILKYKEKLDMLFYEEPEMCLHPQLQQKIAKVICRLVNAGLNMIVTTHSDIILQHINNMIRLSNRRDAAVVCEQFGYSTQDLLSMEKVKVYQLNAKAGGMTEVEELECGEYGFAVPTFNQALERINDEAYVIQE